MEEPKTVHSSWESSSSPTPAPEPKLVEWEKGYDEDNPLLWSQLKKFTVLTIISVGSLCVTCASSAVSSAYSGIEKDLGASREVAILGLSLFVIGLGLGPCIFAPFSEFYGRRPIYLVAFSSFFLLGLPVAFANNLPVFFIFRFLTGFSGSAFLSVSGGSVSDMWLPANSYFPMALYTCSPFMGPVLGPVFSGFINDFTTWRWTFYTITTWAFVTLLAIFFFTPETYAPILLVKKAKRLRNQTGDDQFYAQHEKNLSEKSLFQTVTTSGSRVFLLLALEPMLLLLCLWCAILLGILYLFFELFPTVFEKHNFTGYQVGLSFLGIGVGIMFALSTVPFFAKRYQAKSRASPDGKCQPEARLEMAMVGAIVTPIGLFIFAFTSYGNVHWIAPIIGSIPFGMGILYIYTSVFTFTTDVWRPVAASAMGANSAMRSSFAAAFPLFSIPMTNRLGTVGTAGLLAGLNVAIAPLPFVFARYGPKIRSKSKFAI